MYLIAEKVSKRSNKLEQSGFPSTWSPWVNSIFVVNVIIFLCSMLIQIDKIAFISTVLSLFYIVWWLNKDLIEINFTIR